jgi:hypothetical protein
MALCLNYDRTFFTTKKRVKRHPYLCADDERMHARDSADDERMHVHFPFKFVCPRLE